MKISVIIPVRNGAQTLDDCLNSIRGQTIKDIEIIILDSMSSDNSREIATKYGCRIIEVDQDNFNHGLTRNLGVSYAKGELIFLTVQDARMGSEDMLERMAAHFEDKRLMAVVGHQAIPAEHDKNPLKWRKTFSKPTVQVRDIETAGPFELLSETEQRSIIAWDNVVAMYRKEALTELPFIATEFAEDWIWSKQALTRGWRLIYDPHIIVYHYHHQSYKYAYRVNYAVNYHFYKYLDLKPSIPALVSPMAKAAYHLLKNPALGLREKLYWIGHNCMSTLATFNSHINFLLNLKIGGLAGIEKRYRRVCKTIPQGKHRS